jgi:hypothetical protein
MADLHKEQVLGGGGYGLVFGDGEMAIKLLYDKTNPDALVKESMIQQRARQILVCNNIPVKIPRIINTRKYLASIEMERIFPPEDFEEQVHIAIGYKGSDINNVWYVGDTDVYRGFYCNAEMIEAFGANIEDVAYNMGRALRTLINNGVIPIDVEFILDKNLDVWMIDFGLAEMGNIDPNEYLNKEGWQGLKNDVYVPHEGMPGYESFQAGFLA